MSKKSPRSGIPRIALAQFDVLPGRPDANVERMLGMLDDAREQAVDVVIFPEMCIPGYILGDVWEVDFLVEDYAKYSDAIVGASADLTVVFGNVALDRNNIGEDGRTRKYNAALVCCDGAYVERRGMPPEVPSWIQPKGLHPNYRFFDDDRHFYSLRKLAQARGRPVSDWFVPFEVNCKGERFRFGVQLCEDIWCEDYEYDCAVLDGVYAYYNAGAQAIFNLSCSPWTWQKSDKRGRVVNGVLNRAPVPLYYVNQVGAQNNGKNIIVFDGDSCVYDSQGDVECRAPGWRECLLVPAGAAPVPERVEIEDIYHGIIAGLRHLDHIRGQDNHYLIGVSGGVDSSVVACMLVQALGAERVIAVNMPTQFNSQVTQDNARRMCSELGVDFQSVSIQDLYEHVAATIKSVDFASRTGEYTRLVDENIQARIRGADILAGIAAKFALVYTNNGNKTEVALGYATLYGDVNGAVAPIADLYKPQVLALGRYLNAKVYGREVVPENLLNGDVVPSAELSAAQDVTKGLGDPIKYGYHDALLRQFIEYRRHPGDVLSWFLNGDLLATLEWPQRDAFLAHFSDCGAFLQDLEWVDAQMRINYFKRIQGPPIIVLSKRAFGFDLREAQLPAYRPAAYASLREQVLAADISDV